MYPKSTWFSSASSLMDACAPSLDAMRAIDYEIAVKEMVRGYCSHCVAVRDLKVNGGATFRADEIHADVNLREGLVCQSCGLNSRNRHLYLEARHAWGAGSRLALLEAFSPLSRYCAAVWPGTLLSEFHSPSSVGGEAYDFYDMAGGTRRAIHQDMQALSFANDSLDGIIHNDVLEHVPDPLTALRECHRVIVPGGLVLFTVPWFPWLESTLVRGALDQTGALVEYLPTELHGDGLRSEGIYTFHNFGADFTVLLVQAGFSEVSYGVCYEPFAGMVTNNYRFGDEFLMLPTVIRVRK